MNPSHLILNRCRVCIGKVCAESEVRVDSEPKRTWFDVGLLSNIRVICVLRLVKGWAGKSAEEGANRVVLFLCESHKCTT